MMKEFYYHFGVMLAMLMLLVVLLLTSCSTVRTVTVERVVHDSVYVTETQHDTVYLHEIERVYERGDTVFVEKEIARREIRDRDNREMRDATRQTVNDSEIRTPTPDTPREIRTPNIKTQNSRFARWCIGIVISEIVLAVLAIVGKILLKVYL